MSELLTVQDVARYCQLHESTVRRHITSGKLRSVRVGRSVRVRRVDLDRFFDAQLVVGLPPLLHDEPRPFTMDDPLWQLVGKWHNPENWWVSGDKRRALAEACTSKQ